jgi:hypothetical protein
VGSLSNYDEKVVGELMRYGLPMVQVSMPQQTVPERVTGISSADTFYLNATAGVTTTLINLSFDYTPHDMAGRGRYYTKVGTEEVHGAAGRPIQPLYRVDVYQEEMIAHGVLMPRRSFTEEVLDPVISHIVTDTLLRMWSRGTAMCLGIRPR